MKVRREHRIRRIRIEPTPTPTASTGRSTFLSVEHYESVGGWLLFLRSDLRPSGIRIPLVDTGYDKSGLPLKEALTWGKKWAKRLGGLAVVTRRYPSKKYQEYLRGAYGADV